MDIKELVTSIVYGVNPTHDYADEDLNNQMLDQLTDLIEDIQTHAIVNFWLSLHNMGKHNLIDKVFSNEHDNTKSILEQRLESNDYDIVKFIGSLDEEKRGILIRYIMYNYKGISLEKVQEYYGEGEKAARGVIGQILHEVGLVESIQNGQPIQMKKGISYLLIYYRKGFWFFHVHGRNECVCKTKFDANEKLKEYQRKGFKTY